MRDYFRYPEHARRSARASVFRAGRGCQAIPGDARSFAVSARRGPGSLFHRQRDAGCAGATAQLLPAAGHAQLASLLQKSGSHELRNLRGGSAAGGAIDSSRQHGAGNSRGDCAAVRGHIGSNGETKMATPAHDFRGLMRRRQRNEPAWLHFACFAGAVLAILPLAIGAGFWHQDAPGSEATCAICHVAHLAPLPGSAVGALPASLLIAWHRPAEARGEQPSPSIVNSSPRAPPF